MPVRAGSAAGAVGARSVFPAGHVRTGIARVLLALDLALDLDLALTLGGGILGATAEVPLVVGVEGFVLVALDSAVGLDTGGLLDHVLGDREPEAVPVGL